MNDKSMSHFTDETATSVPTPDSIELAEDALEGAAVTVLTTATAVVTASTPDVPSIMERMVVLSKKDGKELDISELARRFESLEYQVYLMYASNYSTNLDKS